MDENHVIIFLESRDLRDREIVAARDWDSHAFFKVPLCARCFADYWKELEVQRRIDGMRRSGGGGLEHGKSLSNPLSHCYMLNSD